MNMLKQIKYIIFISIILLFFDLDISLAQKIDKSLYNKLQVKLKSLSSVSFNFILKEDPKYQGLVRAKKGNMYDVQTPIRRLICNGITIWNYNEAEKKVVLSNYEGEGGSSISIENIFFNIVQNFKPTETQFLNSNGNESYKITLTPNNPSRSEFKNIILYLNKEDLLINTVQTENKDGIQTWKISNLEINPKFSNKIFEFNIPEGTQIIDLR